MQLAKLIPSIANYSENSLVSFQCETLEFFETTP